MTGVVNEEVSQRDELVAIFHRYSLAEISEPVYALAEYCLARGVLEYFDLPFGYAERTDAVLTKYFAVV